MTPEQIKELAIKHGDVEHVTRDASLYQFDLDQLQAYTDEANAEAIKMHMEGLSKDAVAVAVVVFGVNFEAEQQYDDGIFNEAEWTGDTPKQGTKLYLAPPEVEAVQADNDRLREVLKGITELDAGGSFMALAMKTDARAALANKQGVKK